MKGQMRQAARRALAIALALLLALGGPLSQAALAEASDAGATYLADVRVGFGTSEEAAAKALTDAGYTIMQYGGGYTNAKAPKGYEAYADLNQGADALLTRRKVVYLGYKTTSERQNAITDLAVMGMDGGYSFSDYKQLMSKYRVQTVAPLQAKVMRMVAEYRANAASENPGSRAKAELARALLNRITDEDSGGALGDLLLGKTSQELGATPSTMSEADAAAWRTGNPGVIDLECVLMQGNADVVANVESILASATDTGDTTWLQRLSALGPDGLAGRYADLSPAEAQVEMDAQYQDPATLVAEGWDELQAELTAYDARYLAENPAAAGSGEDAKAQEPIVVEGADEPGIVVEGGDEAAPDVSDLANLDLPEGDEREVSPEDAPEVVGDMARGLEEAGKAVEAAEELQTASVYHTLKSLPWGDGTLYDYFARPGAEVTGGGIAELYPLVSVLTDGQLASLEFQSLSSLAQAGSVTGAAYEATDAAHSNFVEAAQAAPETSVYQGVNREIFGDLTALTSEAMRKEALNAEGAGADDFLSRYKVSLGLTASAAISSMVVGLSSYMFSRAERLRDMYISLKRDLGHLQYIGGGLKEVVQSFKIERIPNAPAQRAIEVTTVVHDTLDGIDVTNTAYFPSNSGLHESMKSFDEAHDLLKKRFEANYYAANRWSSVKKGATVVTLVLVIASIVSAAIDIYRYYNVDFTPIPKYMVDQKSVTATDADGNQVVVRNDAAYYEVARTNRAESASHHDALRDFADLNGDGGRGWVALYTCRDAESHAPILADSLRVVVGSSSLPDGYATGVHDFGSDAAANLTDMRYTYNDDANGIYAYFRREETPAVPAAGSAFAGGTAALAGGAGLVAGAAIGASVTSFAGRRRREVAP